jgi:hypothetical protein
MSEESKSPRFLKLDDVAEELNTTHNQVYALVRTGALRAVKIGGRGRAHSHPLTLLEHLVPLGWPVPV